MSKLDKFLVALIVTVISFWLNAEVISLLWRWFAAQPFGLVQLTLLQATGLQVLARYILQDTNIEIDTDEDKFSKNMFKVISVPIAAIFVGWLIHISM